MVLLRHRLNCRGIPLDRTLDGEGIGPITGRGCCVNGYGTSQVDRFVR